MWNKPQLMTAVSDLLYVAAAAALLVAAVLWSARLPLFPLREVELTHELREIRQDELERSLKGHLRGNFFSVDLSALRSSIEQIAWVRRVDVRRQWPSRIEVTIEEHQPVAFWGPATGQLVNSYGEVFTASLNVPLAEAMPVLQGPTGMAPEMLGHYQQAEEILRPIGRVPRALNVSPRLAVQLRLDDGMIVELGRQQAKAQVSDRLERFVEFYPRVQSAARARPSGPALPVVVVDMRYPNGFALRVNTLAAASVSDSKGTP
jgi:cell division protein FtsQ